ncbi:Hyalin [Holothuria leucospilota]|uniref:Hyalin n=1 Tax=Holothuria leucospilota TaxID=206669 RepID=A0A9Q1CBL9_HOLLE|nr:Hyalin [Holothuria leucospilota]
MRDTAKRIAFNGAVCFSSFSSECNLISKLLNLLVHSFVLSVDDIPPTVNCTDDISITAPSGVNAVPVVWEEPTAIDNSGEEIVQIRRSHDPGSTFPIGETTVMYIFLDSTGNAAECMFNVLVLQAVDDVPPTVHCLDDITITVPSGTTSQSVVWKEPSATDNSGEEPIRISSHDPGFPFPIGETTVTYTFIDSAGNIAQCIFKVILLEEVDDVPPTVNCTDDIIETVPKGTTSQAVAWEEPTAYDNSGEEPLHIRSHDPGFTFPIGETTVTYTFVDATGNTAECSFKIILQEEVDEVPPIVNCTGDITETVPRGTSFHTVSWEEPTAYDNSGDEPLQIRSHDPGSRFPIGRSTVTYSFVDSSGNTANCTFEVILLEAVGPVVTMCPFSKTVVTCNSESVVSWIPPKVLDDNSKVTTSSSHSPGDLFETGESEVTYTFTNQSGNVIAQCSFTIVVEKQTENCRTESFIIYIVIAVGVFLAVFLTVTLMIFFLKLCHHVKYSVSSGKGKNDVQMLRVTRRGAV